MNESSRKIERASISKILSEDSRRLPENEMITIAPGFIGNYPNFLFSMEKTGWANLLTGFAVPGPKPILKHSTVNSAYAATTTKAGNIQLGLMNSIKNIEAYKQDCSI